jgi:hypothetical protein
MSSFAALCSEHTHVCHAEVMHDEIGMRGLQTTGPVPAGWPVLAVPWELVVTAQVSSSSTYRVAAHHLEMANQLLAMLNGTRDDARAQFWRLYAELLPSWSELPHPALLSESLLAELQDSALSAEARASRAHIATELDCSSRRLPIPAAACHSPSSCEPCDVAQWLVALIRSRPFVLPSTSNAAAAAAAAAGSTFAFLPFIDMTNHAEGANCEVRGVGTREGGAYTAAELVALRDLQPGEVVTINYASDQYADLAHQFADFGFVTPGPRHATALPAGAVSDFTTTLEFDEALLRRFRVEPPPDGRLPDIVQYRVLRKRAARETVRASQSRTLQTPQAAAQRHGVFHAGTIAMLCGLSVALVAVAFYFVTRGRGATSATRARASRLLARKVKKTR